MTDSTGPLQLGQWQQWWIEQHAGDLQDPLRSTLVTTGPVAADLGWSVYRKNRVFGAVQALAARYPRCQELLGEENFNFLGREFCDQFPSRSPDLSMYGAEWPAFLAGRDELSAQGWLRALAELEWQWQAVESHRGTYSQGLLQAQVWLQFAPAGVCRVWQAAGVTDPEQLGAIHMDQQEALLVGRKGDDKYCQELDVQVAKVLQALVTMDDIEEICKHCGVPQEFAQQVAQAALTEGWASVPE